MFGADIDDGTLCSDWCLVELATHKFEDISLAVKVAF